MPDTNRPYPPSWIDRLTAWIEALPIPIWAFYLLLYLFAAITLNIASWVAGTFPWGTPSPAQLYNGIWLPVALAVIHNTDILANQAIARFAPLVPNKQKELEDIRYRMTTMPARTVFWLYTFFVVVLLINAIVDPAFVTVEEIQGPLPPLSLAINIFWGVTSYSMGMMMVYHSARQLNLVTKAYRLVDKVDIFHQQPLYAFSRLTMRTALFLVAQVYITYALEPLYDSSATEEFINVALSSVVMVLSIAIVLLPLWGIHQRIVDAKQDALEENSMQIAETRGSLYEALRAKAFEKVGQVESGLSTLFRERELLKTIPTWPWAAGAFRNFLSAILLPMLLWLLQNLAERFL